MTKKVPSDEKKGKLPAMREEGALKKALLLFFFSFLLGGCGGGGAPPTGSLAVTAFILDGSGNKVSVAADLSVGPNSSQLEAKGKTPLTVSGISPGPVVVQVTLPGFSATAQALVEAEKTVSLDVTLTPLPPPSLPF